ncbi:MAG TPA: glutathione S-transferase N-terminal domain-containing protein [Sphingomonas sp.]|uniref:glutathione S-transferase N-terminal domain-containing protein n=1 Tax=Sphingomonas sp. TaxID=28214 RepID=UPI002BAF203B|nr:glutathione S-transferase N-terminal domain-containing protein [Sphingomonas sp.]HMI20038.1 glutathione S-transferase N-terminal domain-containing protein [Sphingomonas sp.]
MSARPIPAPARPILYSFRRCPYAMRARMALLASGTVCEIREVVLRDKPAALIEASPKATVPVLVLPDGQVIDESLDIMRWALGRNDPDHWLEGDDADLIAANDGPFKHHLDRAKYPGRYDESGDHRALALALLAPLEARLMDSAYLCGDRPMLTDFALLPFVRQFAEIDRPWFDAQPLPALGRWLSGLLDTDRFAAAMVRLPAWKVGDPPTLFPSA